MTAKVTWGRRVPSKRHRRRGRRNDVLQINPFYMNSSCNWIPVRDCPSLNYLLLVQRNDDHDGCVCEKQANLLPLLCDAVIIEREEKVFLLLLATALHTESRKEEDEDGDEDDGVDKSDTGEEGGENPFSSSFWICEPKTPAKGKRYASFPHYGSLFFRSLFTRCDTSQERKRQRSRDA